MYSAVEEASCCRLTPKPNRSLGSLRFALTDFFTRCRSACSVAPSSGSPLPPRLQREERGSPKDLPPVGKAGGYSVDAQFHGPDPDGQSIKWAESDLEGLDLRD